jgi:PAS domain S-box-containing protein
LSLGIVLIVLITLIDYLTKDYFILPFYIIPVAVVAWFAGRNMGIIAAFLSALTAIIADIIESPYHAGFPVHYWNGAVIFVFLAAVVYFLQKLVNTIQYLKESEANYHSIFESANDAIFVRDIKTYRIADVNTKACQMFGYSKDEMFGLDLKYLIPDTGEYRYENLKVLYDMASRGLPQLFEWVVKDKLEREFWVEISIKRAIIGRQYCLISITRDISDRKCVS